MPPVTTSRIKTYRNDLAALNTEDSTLRTASANAFAAARARTPKGMTETEKTADDTRKTRLDEIAGERIELEGAIKSEEILAASERVSTAVIATSDATVREGWRDAPNRGYETPKAFLMDVLAASRNPGAVDPRVASLWNGKRSIQATAGSDEANTQNDPYGGFLVPRAHLMAGLKTSGVQPNPFAGRTTKVDMGGADILQINVRVDKDHSTSVSGGLVVYRRVETQTVTASRMKFEQVELRINELMGVTYASEELLRKSPTAFVSLLSAGFGDEFDAKILEETLNGNGVGRYLGIAASPALVTISKEVGQAADTIVYANLVNMMARCFGFGNAIWVANHGCIPQIATMTLPGNSPQPLAFPGFSAAGGSLFGRPIFFSERAAALGDLGDIILVNPAEYLEGETEPMQSASSIHVRFLEHEQTFKFWMANGGAPWWRTALTPKNGPTISPFIYLAAR